MNGNGEEKKKKKKETEEKTIPHAYAYDLRADCTAVTKRNSCSSCFDVAVNVPIYRRRVMGSAARRALIYGDPLTLPLRNPENILIRRELFARNRGLSLPPLFPLPSR